MHKNSGTSIEKHFLTMNDPRHHNKKHKLIDIITISICSVICGADTFDQIEDFGNAKKSWFRKFLELPYGIPSHDTFGRVFSMIDPMEFQQHFMSWVQSVQQIMNGQVVAIDGKTLRRSFDTDSDTPAIHMVSAWASKNRMVLGQIKTKEKSNEITAIPLLLKMLDISGCIVTIDAMGCQKKISKAIVDKDADYIFSLKGNHSNLHDDVKLFFNDCLETNFKDVSYKTHETIDGDHGRIEKRTIYTVNDIDWLQGKELWSNLNTIGMIENEFEYADKTTKERRFFISSLTCDAEKFGQSVRDHWGIENGLHWTLDMAFREDESRIRKGHAPENFAVLRHIALNLLKKENSKRRSIKTKRLRAGWDNDFLLQVINSL